MGAAKTTHIVIPGQPYVKKNTQFKGHNGATLYTKNFNEWHRVAQHIMMQHGFDIGFGKRRKTLKKLKQNVSDMIALYNTPVTLQCRFYVRTHGILDLSNLYEGVQDLLVECGVLDDDNWHIVDNHDGSRVEKDAANPRTEITIIPLDKDAPKPGEVTVFSQTSFDQSLPMGNITVLDDTSLQILRKSQRVIGIRGV